MIIYEFSTWFARKGLFNVKEIEVEEKPKSYIGKNTKINKSEINVLSKSWGNRMYCLESNPKFYVDTMIEQQKRDIEALEKRLQNEKDELEAWVAYRKEIEG